ncbi:TM2 domain-containing membrane protein YozV/SpoVK/Ycf46/Vps4 family AAA+-type ATPase [Chryseobacterium koreense]|nr:TM2 domain-containing membrane protein YozV/SpoVK/Ycf46/Vps4 family AAA+-type ATPase [Chryseobacterium koreense]
MAINFRKRKKILPGVYLNFSKRGISTTVGPRGANINFGKNGAFLNTGIPGTGLYSRQKIGGGNGSGPSFTPANKFAPNHNTTKSEKSKTTTVLLALFFGTFGIHRFYLGQNWKGIFSILFFWTYIPTIISLFDVLVFAVMPRDKFDSKYNRLHNSTNAQTCSSCNKNLAFINTPLWGLGKLNDGTRLCYDCFSKMTKLDSNFKSDSKNKYDTHLVRQVLSGTPVSFLSFDSSSNNGYSKTTSVPTSQSLEELKKHIEEARQARQELETEIRQQQSVARQLEINLKSKQSGFGKFFAKPEQVEKLQAEVKEANEYLTDLYSQYEESQANINMETDKEIQDQYQRVKEAYIELSKSNKIWDIVSERASTETKSAARTSIDRKEVRFTLSEIDFILSEQSAFQLENTDGDHLYIYPAFVLQPNHSGAITLIDLHDLRFRFHSQRFLEEKSTTPSDTQVVDYTWAKVNKDGSPDKRFVDNYQIPVVEYGAFEFATNSGLKEVYYISNLQLAEKFANEFRKYLSLIRPVEPQALIDLPPKIYNQLIEFDKLDPLTVDAARIIVSSQQASTSFIQRQLRIGYNRAGRIMDELESIGIVGSFNGAKARETLVQDLLTLEKIFDQKADNHQVSQNKAEFGFQYYSLLKDFSKSLSEIVQKLQSNEAILERINAEQLLTTSDKFIANCVIYDMIQVSNLLAKGKLSAKSLEAAGLVLATNQLLPDHSGDMLDKDFDTLATAHQQGLYEDIARKLLEIGAMENPMQISIQEKEDEKIISSTEQQSNLSFPTFLKISDNPLFEEYATVIYRYATIISKADNVVSKTEETLLKVIYQLTHNPIPEKKNEALYISKGTKNETLDEVLHELNSLIGLNEVKSEINTLINFIKVQKAREQSGLKSPSLSYHIVFTGNPGTGKTTVARIVSKIYKHLGILTEGQLVETDRSGLIAEYVGQTAVKVNQTVNSALNGILFIDEAYSLVGENKDDFGREAVATLIKRMEDDRDKLVLVLAGYTNEMTNFIDTNPGFKSRFNRYINFPDYTPSELFEIFESNCVKLDYQLTEEAETKLKLVFENAYSTRDRSFGNGRFVRNVFEKTLEQQANRIAKESNLTKEILTTITENDIV